MIPKLPSKILPKIKISNIDGAIRSTQIVKILFDKNPDIHSKVEAENSIFDLVFTKKDLYSNTQKAIIKCSPSIRSLIMKSAHILIDCDCCPCQAHFFVFQCHHCASFGHSAARCPRNNKENLGCLFCAAKGTHDSDHCPTKFNMNGHACVNCSASNEHDIRVDAISHSGNSKYCPIYLREISKLALKTDYGNDFVYT